MRAADLALLDDGDRHLAEALDQLGLVLQQLHEADRAGQPGRAAADDRHADVDALVLVVERALDELLARVDGRRELARSDDLLGPSAHAPSLRAFTASVRRGRILFRSPTTPRSENSKIGALASLLMATMFSEDCMPTLCWIAPEMPAAR